MDGGGLGDGNNTEYSAVFFLCCSLLLLFNSPNYLINMTKQTLTSWGLWYAMPFFLSWTRTTVSSCSGKGAAHWKGCRNRICKASSLAVRWSCTQEMFTTEQLKVAERLWWLPEGRCYLPLSWTCSGTGVVTDGAGKLLSQPKVNVATAAGRSFQLVQEVEWVMVWHVCEIPSKGWGSTLVSIKPEIICVELHISSPMVDASLCSWPWG